jgi:hypothetical protein
VINYGLDSVMQLFVRREAGLTLRPLVLASVGRCRSLALDNEQRCCYLRNRMNAQPPSSETKPDLPLEIADLLLIDLVGYSKLLVNEQIELLQELNQIVRGTESFRMAEASGKLIRVPTGDGTPL